MSIKYSKYFKIEAIFFTTYFYVFRILTDLEYNFWERKISGISFSELEHSLAYGTSSLAAFYIFYRIVRNYLSNRKLLRSIGFVLLFLVCFSTYQKGINYFYAHLDFLSAEVRSLATQAYKVNSIGYSLAYMFKEFLAISCLAYFIHADKQKEQMKALKEEQLISELTYLKSQLQPHFFFNTMNNIYGLALQRAEETAPLVAKLAEMMRYILYRTDEKFVSLNEEIEFIRNYVEVENIRYRSMITISFEVQGIDEDSKISPLLLLPFIENAFKHGIQEEQKEGFVDVVICKTEAELIMEVSNSIAGSKKNTCGIGLVNLKKRLEILYPKKYKLQIQNDEKVYHVSLTLALI
ncbi:sensor histidine kinase [Flavitalea sp.]|nr:histidine kinase [Flavitalea sp.]